MPASTVVPIVQASVDSGMSPAVVQAITGMVSAAIGGIATTLVAKFFLAKYIKDNDLKHEKAESEAKEKNRETALDFADVKRSLSDISSSLKVNVALFNDFKVIKSTVDNDHDSLIRNQTQTDSNTKDINAQYSKLRDIQKDVSNVRLLVSEVRKLTK